MRHTDIFSYWGQSVAFGVKDLAHSPNGELLHGIKRLRDPATRKSYLIPLFQKRVLCALCWHI